MHALSPPAEQTGDLARSRGRRLRGDRGAADIGIEMMFGAVVMIALFLFLIEVGAYWHARNVLDEAAAEGARVAAAFDGTCAEGEAVAEARVAARGGGWADGVDATCTETADIVTVVITSSTPGFLSSTTGYEARVTESAPRER
ncbi:MAG: TadE/TadG family type IV pilus assembly protein [Actinomycetota bacterium]